MKRLQRLRNLIPPWQMPSDPIKAVWWFLHWLLQLVVNFFWLPMLVMAIIETSSNWRVAGPFNGIVSGVVTLVVGAFIWMLLFGVLLLANVTGSVKQAVSQATQLRQTLNGFERSYFSPLDDDAEPRGKVVEGSITDLDEERRKRRQEQK